MKRTKKAMKHLRKALEHLEKTRAANTNATAEKLVRAALSAVSAAAPPTPAPTSGQQGAPATAPPTPSPSAGQGVPAEAPPAPPPAHGTADGGQSDGPAGGKVSKSKHPQTSQPGSGRKLCELGCGKHLALGYHRRHITERCKLISKTYKWPCCGKIEKRMEYMGTESFKRHFTRKNEVCQHWWVDDTNVQGRPATPDKSKPGEVKVAAVDMVQFKAEQN